MITLKKISNRKKLFLYVVCWVISVGIGIHFRLYPLYFHASLDAKDKASLLVLTKLRSSVLGQIDKNASGITGFERNRLAAEALDKLMRNEHNKVRYSIDKLAKELDAKSSNKKIPPFLLEADPYNFYELTQNIVETGKISETIKGSKYFNKRMLAPLGHWEPFTLLPYVGYLFYKFISFFSPQVSLMYTVSFVPLIITSLSLILFLAVCYLLDCSLISSFLGSVFFILAPMFIQRTAFGWYDNDPYNIFFPLWILMCLFLGLNRITILKKAVFFAILSSFSMTLYALFWQGWMYLLGIIAISSILILGYSFLFNKNREEMKHLFWFLGIVNLGSFVFISIFLGMDDFFILFQEGWKALTHFLSPQLSSWPDIFIGVGELKRGSWGDIIERNGNLAFFIFSLLGLLFYSWHFFRKSKNCDPFKYIVIVMFFICTVFLALGAQRFVLLSLTPLAILFPLGLEQSYDLIRTILSKNRFLKLPSFFLPATAAIIIMIMLTFSFRHAQESMVLWRPIYDETWDSVMTKIKQETSINSIINSWWPPGHFITSMAHRRVTFDGATINNPQAYWMANQFLSQDEGYAVGVLRMLNNSANQAIDYLESKGIKLSQAVKIIQTIIVLNHRDAAFFLKTLLKPDEIEKLLMLTHSYPPPSYIFIYNDLMEKNLELSFIGQWNFERIENIQNNPQALKEIPPRNSADFIRFLWDTVGGPLNYSEILGQIDRKSNMVFLNNGIIVNLWDMTCRFGSKKFGQGIPQSIIYLNDNNEVTEKHFSNASLPYSLLFFKDDPLYSGMVLDRRLAKSMLFRLYFFKGQGLKYFKPFIEKSDLTKRTKIIVFQIDWKKYYEDIGE